MIYRKCLRIQSCKKNSQLLEKIGLNRPDPIKISEVLQVNFIDDFF